MLPCKSNDKNTSSFCFSLTVTMCLAVFTVFRPVHLYRRLPAAGLISYFEGQHLIIINKDATPYDRDADVVIHDDMVDVVNAIRD